MLFVYLHIIWFGCWIGFGVEDYPYGLLTMIVSLEAIFLSTFVMISQNRADARRQVIADEQWKMVQEEDKQNVELLDLSRQILTLTKEVRSFADAIIGQSGHRPRIHPATEAAVHPPQCLPAACQKCAQARGQSRIPSRARIGDGALRGLLEESGIDQLIPCMLPVVDERFRRAFDRRARRDAGRLRLGPGARAWNLAADQNPAAVAFAESADDVAAAVRFAASRASRSRVRAPATARSRWGRSTTRS